MLRDDLTELDALVAAHVLNLSGAETIPQLRAPPRLRKRLRRRLDRNEHDAVLARLRFEPLEPAQLRQLNSHIARCRRCLKRACARVRAPRPRALAASRQDRGTHDGNPYIWLTIWLLVISAAIAALYP